MSLKFICYINIVLCHILDNLKTRMEDKKYPKKRDRTWRRRQK